MIRSVAALDDCLGLAIDTGIPWDVPADVEHFRTCIASSDVLMGYATYLELERPLPGGTNFVAARVGSALRDGFAPVADLPSFLREARADDLWIVGGAKLYGKTLPFVEELELTRVEGDFGCTKFFPPFESWFAMATDAGFTAVGDTPAFRFQTWRRRPGLPGPAPPV
jgi:dihydrofolate reductase